MMKSNLFKKFSCLATVMLPGIVMAQNKKTNVIVIMGDEHPYFLAGCYGDKVTRTPNLDKLASEGVVMDASYCGSPISAPSRASFMTGRHVHIHEVWDNAAPLRSDWPTFAHSFANAGYRTILCGKMHFVGPDQLHGFTERWTSDIYPATFDWSNSNRDSVYVNTGQNIFAVKQASEGRSPDMDWDEEVLFRAKQGLRYLARNHKNEPYMMCISFTGPHYPFHAPRKYWDMYTDDQIEVPRCPENFMEHESKDLQWARTMGRFETILTDQEVRNARHAVMSRVSMVDDYIGEIIGVLKETNQYDNAIIVYTSDHGDMMGEHGLWFKNTALEASARIPMIIKGDHIPAGKRISEPISLTDLGPTLCGLAGVDLIYDRIDGRDVSDLIEGRRPSSDGLAIMELYGEGTHKGWRMIRKGQYKLVYQPDDILVLYDLEKDPKEWNNVAGDPKYRKIVKEMVAIAMDGWEDYERYDEMRWQSEERRMALKKLPRPDWDYQSTPCPHPYRDARRAEKAARKAR